MKKLMLSMCCLAVVLASTQAFADQPTLSISDVYHQAQTGWHQSYHTTRGETVTVDIDIAVPNVSTFPSRSY